MKNVLKSIICITAFAISLSGCKDADLESGSVLESTTTASQTKVQQPTAKATVNAKNKTTNLDNKTVASTPAKTYRPPFPNRTTIFSPPLSSRPKEKRQDNSNGSVALQGFADVNGLKAILEIDGVIAPLAEGSEKFGIQVITIQPPKVVLQRGRDRWTASLEN